MDGLTLSQLSSSGGGASSDCIDSSQGGVLDNSSTYPLSQLSQLSQSSSCSMFSSQSGGGGPTPQHMKVFLRIRPVLSANTSCQVRFDSDSTISIVAPEVSKRAQYTKLEERHYTFNKVFPIEASQSEIFESIVEPMMARFIRDRGSCVLLAYGMTNAGKTHTMQGNPHDEGLFPRLIRKITDSVAAPYDLKISMAEIYQEKVYDLLSDKKVELKLRETKDKVIEVVKLTSHQIADVDTVMSLFNLASLRRSKTSTALNESSSRSHAVYTLSLDIRGVVSHFHVVDLAGAERGNRTKSSFTQQKEASYINTSLMKLWRCLQGMRKKSNGDSTSGLDIIPYRESKLTYLLMPDIAKAGLNGVAMITCINPQVEDYDETISILSNASLAFKIKEIVDVISRPPPPPPKVKEDIKHRNMKSSLQGIHKNAKRKHFVGKDSNAGNDDDDEIVSEDGASIDFSISTVDVFSELPEYKRMKLEIESLKQENEFLLRDQIVKETEIRAEVCNEMELHSKMLLEKIQLMQEQLFEKSRESYSITKSAKKAKKKAITTANENAALELMNTEEDIEKLKLMFEIDMSNQREERLRLEREIEQYRSEEAKLSADLIKLKNILKGEGGASLSSPSRSPLSPVKSPLTSCSATASSALKMSPAAKSLTNSFTNASPLMKKGSTPLQTIEIFSDTSNPTSLKKIELSSFDQENLNMNCSRTDYFLNLRSGKDNIVKSLSSSSSEASPRENNKSNINNNFSMETNENAGVSGDANNAPADAKSYFRQLRNQFSMRA